MTLRTGAVELMVLTRGDPLNATILRAERIEEVRPPPLWT